MLDMLLLILLFILITVIDLIINRTEQGIYFNLSIYIQFIVGNKIYT